MWLADRKPYSTKAERPMTSTRWSSSTGVNGTGYGRPWSMATLEAETEGAVVGVADRVQRSGEAGNGTGAGVTPARPGAGGRRRPDVR